MQETSPADKLKIQIIGCKMVTLNESNLQTEMASDTISHAVANDERLGGMLMRLSCLADFYWGGVQMQHTELNV
jgi:hypothetical protein